LILWRLGDRTRRYGELKRLLPEITEKMLIAQLRELEAVGILQRKSNGEVPPRVEYALTPHGEKLKPVLEAMCGWGQEHIRQFKRKALNPVYIWPDPASML
jgi:DNA-binding HxlR family transcriptional regulator